VLLDECERCAPLETGGVLLGYHEDSGRDVVALEALGPGPDAEHRGRRFTPDPSWHSERIAQRYESSGRIITYLGDWHSHPTSMPVPSPLDLRTARRIARTPDARAPEPMMVIVGRSSPDTWMLVALRYRRRRLRQMQLVVFDDTSHGRDRQGC
jgi:integrative and conjugative element protein (TIGR02256 family)